MQKFTIHKTRHVSGPTIAPSAPFIPSRKTLKKRKIEKRLNRTTPRFDAWFPLLQLPLFNSMYEVFNALTVVAKQHFLHYFTGKSLSSIWTTAGGTGTAIMADSINGGVVLSAGVADNIYVAMNNKRQFVHQGCISIWVCKILNNSSEQEFGFLGDAIYTNAQSMALGGMEGSTTSTNWTLETSDGTTDTAQDTGVVADTNLHSHKIESTSSNTKYYVDGVLLITKTTNKPIAKMQLGMVARSRETNTTSLTVLSVEAFNT